MEVAEDPTIVIPGKAGMTPPMLHAVMFGLCALLGASCADREASAPSAATTDAPARQPASTEGTMSQSKMNVLGYRYHPDTQILSVRFSGGTYRYAAVPPAVYDAWVSAGANEMATSEALKDKYTAVYVQPGSSDKGIDP